MSFLPVIALAVLAFLFAAFALKLPRSGWTLFGAALLFGLTGYALQGSPGQAGAPTAARVDPSGTGEAMVEARRAMFDPGVPPARFITLADGYARRGQFADAAAILRGAVRENPRDPEAWLALGNALVEHADGRITPAAIEAHTRAGRADPEHPGAPYFTGLALIREGRPAEARQAWAAALEALPADSPWRDQFAERLEVLDMMLAREGATPPR